MAGLGCPGNGTKSPRPGHLKSLAWPAEDSRAPVAMGGSCPVPLSPHISARLVVFQVVFLIIFIKASFSGQLSLVPKAHVYFPLYCPTFCICIYLSIFCLRDPEDLCGDRGMSPGLAWGHCQHFLCALQLASVDMQAAPPSSS